MNLHDSGYRSNFSNVGLLFNGATMKPNRVLYLNPVEFNVWSHILGSAKLVGRELRFAAPCDLECLHVFWTDVIRCTAGQYADAFIRFADAGLISRVGLVRPELDSYRLNVSPSEFRVIQIEKREVVETDEVWISIIKDLTSLKFIPPTNETVSAFRKWIAESYPDVNPNTAQNKLFYFKPGNRHIYTGVIIRDSETNAWLVAWNGFEAYEFRPNTIRASVESSFGETIRRQELKIQTLEKALLDVGKELRSERAGRRADKKRVDKALERLRKKWIK